MFRELARKNKGLPMETCIALLQSEKRGVLSLLGDDDYPYGVPLNHWYCPADGKLYFHSGKAGHKIDALKKHPKASFCVYNEGFRCEGEWALNISSVIVFGKISIVEDRARALEISRRLSYKFTRDEAYIQNEIDRYGDGVLVFALEPEHVCGKLVKEA